MEPVAVSKTCPSCGKNEEPHARFCGRCGTEFPLEPSTNEEVPQTEADGELCSSCGNREPSGGSFCSVCGIALADRGVEPHTAPQVTEPEEVPQSQEQPRLGAETAVDAGPYPVRSDGLTVGTARSSPMPAASHSVPAGRVETGLALCPSCGHEQEAGTAFCGECGTAVADRYEREQVDRWTPLVRPPKAPYGRQGRTRGVALVILVFALLAAGSIAAYLATRPAHHAAPRVMTVHSTHTVTETFTTTTQRPDTNTSEAVPPSTKVDAYIRGTNTILGDSHQQLARLRRVLAVAERGSISWETALRTTQGIESRRSALLAKVITLAAPPPFAGPRRLLITALRDSIRDDRALESWEQQRIRGSQGARELARANALAATADSAKARFLRAYRQACRQTGHSVGGIPTLF